MATRKIMDCVDNTTGEKIYPVGHAMATYMSDGKTVEDTIKNMGSGGGGQQEVHIIPASGGEEVYAGLKAAWDAGVRIFYLDTFYMGVIPAIVAPADEDLSSFMLMYNLTIPNVGDSTDITSAQMQIAITQITESGMETMAVGALPIGSGGGGGTHLIDPDSATATEDLRAAWNNGVRSFAFLLQGMAVMPCTVIDWGGGGSFMVAVYQAINEPAAINVDFYANASSSGPLSKTLVPFSILANPPIAYPLENHTEATAEIAPNTFHVWDEVSALTLTLGAEEEGRASEYIFQFTSAATPTTLSLPSTLTWANGEALTPEVNKTYQVSIVNGLAVYTAFE